MSGKPLSCVLLADRHHGVTEGVRGLLETAFDTVVMVADEASLLEGAARLQPEVAVVDLSLAQDRGLGWLRALRQRCPDLKVIVLSVHDEQTLRRATMEAGADAFVLKRAIVTDLLRAVELVRGGRDAEAPTDETLKEADPSGSVGEEPGSGSGPSRAPSCSPSEQRHKPASERPVVPMTEGDES